MPERVQRRTTKIIPKLTNISYDMRLNDCGLTTLETRRLRGPACFCAFVRACMRACVRVCLYHAVNGRSMNQPSTSSLTQLSQSHFVPSFSLQVIS